MPYAHPEALVATDWLAAHLGDPRVRIVDASFTLPGITPTARENYDREHIPGAVFFDIDDIAEPGTSLPHMIPSPDLFAQKIGRARHRRRRQGDCLRHANGLSSAGRAWWMLRMFGHHDVALLNGGLPKWKSEGRPLTADVPTPGAAPVHSALRPVAGARQSRDHRQSVEPAGAGGRCPRRRPLRRLDAGSPPGLRSGHIPGSRNLPYDRVTDPQTQQIESAEALRASVSRGRA